MALFAATVGVGQQNYSMLYYFEICNVFHCCTFLVVLTYLLHMSFFHCIAFL
jgi:hypothetical protein